MIKNNGLFSPEVWRRLYNFLLVIKALMFTAGQYVGIVGGEVTGLKIYIYPPYSNEK